MSGFKSLLWVAMPPSAILSLASLLTYLAFRLYYLTTSKQEDRGNSSNDVDKKQLRTVVLPWILFGLELMILRMLNSR